jgi:hypothetical protein
MPIPSAALPIEAQTIQARTAKKGACRRLGRAFPANSSVLSGGSTRFEDHAFPI